MQIENIGDMKEVTAVCPLGHPWDTIARCVMKPGRMGGSGRRAVRAYKDWTLDLDNCPTCGHRRGLYGPRGSEFVKQRIRELAPAKVRQCEGDAEASESIAESREASVAQARTAAEVEAAEHWR